MDGDVAIVEKVIEAAGMEAVGGRAVTDVVEGGGFAELDCVLGDAARGARTGSSAKRGPVIAGDIASIGKFGEQDRAGGVFDGAFEVKAGRNLR